MTGNDERSMHAQEWVDRHLAGDLSPEEQRLFEALLASSESARDALARAVQVELDLVAVLGSGMPVVSFDRPSTLRRWWWSVAVAAALLLSVLYAVQWFGGSTRHDDPTAGVATTMSLDAMLAKPGVYSLDAGTRLELGTTTIAVVAPAQINTKLVDRDPSLLPIALLDGVFRVDGHPPDRRLQTSAGHLAAAGPEASSYEIRVSRSPEGTPMPTVSALRSPVISTLLVLSGLVAYQSTGSDALLFDADAGVVTLSNDGSLGRVRDREGLAYQRSRGSQRWTLLSKESTLRPGDWIKTGTRGANAAVLMLANGTRLTLGPATHIDLVGVNAVKLVRGEVHVEPASGSRCEIEGPGGAKQTLDSGGTIAIRDDGFVRLESDPRWLVGYRSDRSTDALGSLLANVDGRDVPLTMGYHKVTVDIRDQIARTVIEESFVNHTDSVLEGVFYFPLPADASISGFAMWINGEKVHGEIVEKQRAREIYETILRERRDPGLLEWAGGSIFKARVFPISSEKRIEISYTQVLSKTAPALADAASPASSFRYRYALASDLTRSTPLEKLEIHVRVASEDRLLGVASPSHACRVESTDHTARVEYSAEDISPDRDFELVVQTESSTEGPLRAITHRRGDDGYFMLLLDALPLEGSISTTPIARDLIVVVDTSGSIDELTRRSQVAALDALLGGLGESDRFALVTVDSEVRWLGEAGQRSAGDASSVESALKFFEARPSFGGTRLVDALQQALSHANDDTHVVYLGDGVDTVQYFDPTALLNEVRRTYRRGRVHSVAVGPHEARVMNELATTSGGSVREITTPENAIAVVQGLLDELSRPTIENLQLDVRGVDVAAIHPKVLPNLPIGSQAVVVGRFDATQESTGATVRVQGRLGATEWQAEFPLELRAEDGGNSFIPRLWARRHLDHLLNQGTTPRIATSIIELSEDFQIATPYTSFLVLETEEDRERFGVQKRMRIRDGERFFADGRDSVEFALVQQAMLAAKTWRVELRSHALDLFRDMGRAAFGPASGAAYAVNGASSGSTANSGWGLRGQTATQSLSLGVQDEELAEGSDSGVHGIFDLDDEDEESGDRLPSEEFFQPLSTLATPRPAGRRQGRAPNSKMSLAQLDESLVGRADQNRLRLRTGPLLDHFPPVPGRHFERPVAQWPDAILDRLHRLDRTPTLSTQPLEVRQTTVVIHPSGARLSPSRAEWLLSESKWFQTTLHRDGDAYQLHWFDGEERGVARADWLLGSVRAVLDGDANAWGVPMESVFQHIAAHFSQFDFVSESNEMTSAGDSVWRITLRMRRDPETWAELDIDLAKQLICVERYFQRGKLTSTTTVEEFSEEASAWWPARSVVRGPDGAVVQEHTLEVRARSAEEFSREFADKLAFRSDAVLIGSLKNRLDALQAIRDAESSGERARIEDQLVVADWHLAALSADRSLLYLSAIWETLGDKLGRSRLELAALPRLRRNEEFRRLTVLVAERLAENVGLADRAAIDELYDQAHALGWSERAPILASMETIYRRLQRPEIMAEYRYRHVARLRGIGDSKRARDQLRSLCADYPERVQWIREYANSLAEIGELDRALIWIDEIEVARTSRTAAEVRDLRALRFDLLRRAGRLAEAVDYAEAWLSAVDRDGVVPPDYQRLELYLTDVLRLDRVDTFNQLLANWLSIPLVDLTPVNRSKVTAALRHALGQAQGLYRNQPLPGWHDPLFDLARRALDAEEFAFLSTVMSHDALSWTESGRAFQAAMADRVEAEVETLSYTALYYLLSGLRSAEVERRGGAEWRRGVASRILTRWIEAATEIDRNDRVAAVVLAHGGAAEQLAYWRHRVAIERNPHELHRLHAQVLRSLLAFVGQSDSVDRLIPEIVDILTTLASVTPLVGEYPDERETRVDHALAEIRYVVDTFPASYVNAQLRADPTSNDLTRRALAVKRDGWAKEGRRRLIDMLQQVASVDFAVSRFLLLETVWVASRDASNSAVLVEPIRECLGYLLEDLDETEEPVDRATARRTAYLERCIASLGHFALFGPSDIAQPLREELVARLRRGMNDGDSRHDFAGWLATFYVALDDVTVLQQFCVERYGNGARTEQLAWGRLLAYLRAELGEFESAITMLDAIDAQDPLSSADLASVARWYQLLGDQEQWRKAKIRSFESSSEWQLSWWIDEQAEVLDEEVPGELSADVEFAFVALLRKARSPTGHASTLLDLYLECRDFRLLRSLAGAVVGHSAQGIYPVVESFRVVVNGLQEEAALDQCVEQIEFYRAGDLTDLDRRALDLMEFFAGRRALELGHGIEQHERSVLAALQRADQTTFAEGEALAKSKLLGGIGEIRSTAVLDEVVKQLAACQRSVPRGSIARTEIAFRRAATLWQNHGHESADRGAAVRIAEAAIEEVRSHRGDRMPAEAQHFLSVLGGYYLEQGRHRDGERLWKRELDTEYPATRKSWIYPQWIRYLISTYEAGAGISLGSGFQLFAAIESEIDRLIDLRYGGDHQVVHLVQERCRIWQSAKIDRDILQRRVLDFAFRRVPEILDRQQHRQSAVIVNKTAEAVCTWVGPIEAVRFLTVRAENEPYWVTLANTDFWRNSGSLLARYLREVEGGTGELSAELERRTLQIVLTELRRDLTEQGSRYEPIYHDNYREFWSKHQDRFVEVAREVAETQTDSGPGILYVARYLFHGVGKANDAFGYLRPALRRGLLDLDGQFRFARMLHEVGETDEAIPILESVLAARPRQIPAVTLLVNCYAALGRTEDATRILATTESEYRSSGAPSEMIIAMLAHVAESARIATEAIRLYGEAINLRTRTHASRSDETLSGYYEKQSKMYFELGRIKEAVDAAVGAIVTGAGSRRRLSQSVNQLQAVLTGAPDLTVYVALFEAEVAESRIENPILRHAIGAAFVARSDVASAIPHLVVAVELDENNSDYHRSLINAYDALGDYDRAIEATTRLATIETRDLQLLRDLGDRLTRLERSAEAERAYSALVEATPNESEGHTALAEVREEQKNFRSGNRHWREVTRIRSLEPTGYYRLAKGLITVGEYDEAREVIEQLRTTEWPEEFGSQHGNVLELEALIP